MVSIEFLMLLKVETSSSFDLFLFLILFFTIKLIRVKRTNVTQETNQAK